MTDVQIECFLSVCETLNFTATATKMFYTPQGVSKLISTLEDELELTLFERDKQNRPLRITPAGQYCRENLMARQRRFTRIMGEIHGWYQQLSRHFRLGISEWVDPYSHDMAKVLLGFRQEHPDLVFEAVFDSNDSLLRRAEAGELDAVIISGGQHFPGNDLESEPLARERISVVVPEYVCGADWARRTLRPGAGQDLGTAGERAGHPKGAFVHGPLPFSYRHDAERILPERGLASDALRYGHRYPIRTHPPAAPAAVFSGGAGG